MKKTLTLDLTNDKCPIAFIKTREFLSRSPKNKDKYLIVSSKNTLNDLTSTFKEQQVNFSVIQRSGNFIIKIKKLNV